MSAEKQKVDFNDDIAILPLVQWLDYTAGCDESVFVALPLIQRGSVWKPEQLINLWDTLLRGMPLGSLIYSKIPKDTIVREIGENKSFPAPEGAIGLIDGQQRTLAMLIAWLNVGEKMDRRIWVDFADKPSDEHLFCLYVTTKNQPFGFQKLAPNSKLSLNERRKAWKVFEDECGEIWKNERLEAWKVFKAKYGETQKSEWQKEWKEFVAKYGEAWKLLQTIARLFVCKCQALSR